MAKASGGWDGRLRNIFFVLCLCTFELEAKRTRMLTGERMAMEADVDHSIHAVDSHRVGLHDAHQTNGKLRQDEISDLIVNRKLPGQELPTKANGTEWVEGDAIDTVTDGKPKGAFPLMILGGAVAISLLTVVAMAVSVPNGPSDLQPPAQELDEDRNIRNADEQSEVSPVLTLGYLIQTGRFWDYCILMLSAALAWTSCELQVSYLVPWALINGFSSFEAGVILGLSPIISASIQLLAPFIGRLWGQRNMFTAGLVGMSASLGLYSASPWLSQSIEVSLFKMLLACSITAGVSDGLVTAAAGTLLLQLFPDVYGQIIGHDEVCCGLGTAVGPALGGFLFARGGFPAPTATVGVLAFSLAIASCLHRRSQSKHTGGHDDEEVAHRLPDKWVFSTSLFGYVVTGFVMGARGPAISKYYTDVWGWSSDMIGTVISGAGILYMPLAVWAGWTSDLYAGMPRLLACIGLLIGAAAISAISSTSHVASVIGVLSSGVAEAFYSVPAVVILARSAPFDDVSFLTPAMQFMLMGGIATGQFASIPLYQEYGVETFLTGIGCFVGAFGFMATAVFACRPR